MAPTDSAGAVDGVVHAKGVTADIGGIRAAWGRADLQRTSLPQRPLGHDLLTFEPAVSKLHPQPRRHVEHSAAGTACRGLRIRLPLRGGHPLAVDLLVQCRPVRLLHEVPVAVGRVVHPQRHEHHPVGQALPGGAAGLCGGLTAHGQPEVAVGVGDPEGRQRYVAHPLDDRVAVEAERLEFVSGEARQAAAVGVEVRHRDVTRRVLLGKLKAGEELSHRVVPLQVAFADRRGHDRGAEGLGHRRELEDRLRSDGLGALAVADPEPAAVDKRIVVHDRHRDPGHTGLGLHLFDDARQLRHRLIDVGGVGLRRSTCEDPRDQSC